jgi:hypothetical protein
MTKTRRALLLQDHDLQKQIEDIDVSWQQSKVRCSSFVLHFKENMVNGVSRDLSIMFELWQFIPTVKPLNHAKQPLRAKLQQVQMERAELEHKLEETV